MSDQFLAEIRIFGFNFPPSGWATCDGQLMPLSQSTALFALLGTTFGGNGKSNFALPDLQNSVPVQAGQSSTGTYFDLGQQAGSQTETLLQSEMPVHTHTVNALIEEANERQPPNQAPAIGNSIGFYDEAAAQPGVSTAPQATGGTGGSLPHNNMMPYMTMLYCIALQGIFPSRP